MSLGKQYLDLAVSLRRAIHKRPEPGWCEFETTYKIVSTLEGLGFDVKFGIDAVAPEAVMGRNEAESQEVSRRTATRGARVRRC